MRIAIVGAGITGLTAAYSLSQKRQQVFVFEKNPFLGGLASGFKRENWSWFLDRFYHHLFISDNEAIQLIKELNLSHQLHFYQANTAVQLNKEQARLCTPFDLLRLRELNLSEKMRMAASLAFLKFNPLWQSLEGYYASEWLSKIMGEKGFRTIWQPLLKSKFGKYTKQINLTWFWARIKKRSFKLGYLDGGFQVLVDKIASKIKENGGKIFLKTPVKKIVFLAHAKFQIKGKTFDKVIVTCPTPVFLQIAPQLPSNYSQKLAHLKLISALNLILILKHQLSDVYWLNIVQDWPFLVAVEQTNLISSPYYGKDHLVYLGIYGEKDKGAFRKTKEQLLREWLPYLSKINPDFKDDWLSDSHLFKEDFSQPLVGLHHSQKIPSLKTPINNLYLANQSLIYPWDRGINYAIELGKKVAEISLNS